MPIESEVNVSPRDQHITYLHRSIFDGACFFDDGVVMVCSSAPVLAIVDYQQEFKGLFTKD